MIKHVILWKLKDEYSGVEVDEIKKGIKTNLEALKGVIPEIADIEVITDGLDKSTADLMLDSSFESMEALNAYSVSQAHQDVANVFVRPYVQTRLCLNYEG